MGKHAKTASNMFFIAGGLWVVEAIGEVFGGFVEDFSTISDYVAEASFGISFLALFLAALYLVKDRFGDGGKKQGWLMKTGLFLLGLAGFMLTGKAITNVVYHAFGGEDMLFAEEGMLNMLFLVGVLISLLGVIIFGISCMIHKTLPWWVALALTVSILLVFIPVFGKYAAALVYALIGAYSMKRQESAASASNKVIA